MVSRYFRPRGIWSLQTIGATALERLRRRRASPQPGAPGGGRNCTDDFSFPVSQNHANNGAVEIIAHVDDRGRASLCAMPCHEQELVDDTPGW